MIRVLGIWPPDPLDDPAIRRALSQPRAAEVRKEFGMADSLFPPTRRRPEER